MQDPLQTSDPTSACGFTDTDEVADTAASQGFILIACNFLVPFFLFLLVSFSWSLSVVNSGAVLFVELISTFVIKTFPNKQAKFAFA